MTLLKSKYCIISVIGSHAGEDISPIFLRKKDEISANGRTYWLIKSFKARTLQIQELCKKAEMEGEDVYCLFITASTKNGARPTSSEALANHISKNNTDWEVLENGVRITGKIDAHSTALVLSELEVYADAIMVDLWDYSDMAGGPVKLQLGASTVCCERKFSEGMKSRLRNVAGWGKLAAPYGVWVR